MHVEDTALFNPVASATLSDAAPAHRRGAWLSTYATAQGAGQALGPVLAGYLVATGRFDLAFLTAGFIGLAAPAIVFRWPAAPAVRRAGARWADAWQGVREVGRDRLVLVTSAAQAAQFVVTGALNTFLPLFGADIVGMGGAELGWLLGAWTLTVLAVRPLVGRLSDRAGRLGVIVSGMTVAAAGVLLVSVAARPAALFLAVMLYAAGVATTTAATSAFITDQASADAYHRSRSPRSQRARAARPRQTPRVHPGQPRARRARVHEQTPDLRPRPSAISRRFLPSWARPPGTTTAGRRSSSPSSDQTPAALWPAGRLTFRHSPFGIRNITGSGLWPLGFGRHRSKPPSLHPCHSLLSAVAASTRVARRAGTRPARAASPSSRPDATA
ncbi:MAG: MFS transporter [Acidobacteriota bacterium]